MNQTYSPHSSTASVRGSRRARHPQLLWRSARSLTPTLLPDARLQKRCTQRISEHHCTLAVKQTSDCSEASMMLPPLPKTNALQTCVLMFI